MESNKRRLCECGCGKPVRLEQHRFILGHNSRVNPPIPRKPKPLSKLCKCGCGEYAKSGNDFITGHNRRGQTQTEEAKRKISKVHSKNPPVLNRKNYKHSKKTREKIRKANTGYIPSEQTRRKWSLIRKGRKHSEETKKKISKINKGRKITWADKISLSHIGDKNPNWRGGISCEPYCDAWLDKEFKESIKERDDYKCQNPDCWEKKCDLTIHHIDYIKKNCHPNNLITLCRSCNARANGNRKYWRELYISILEKRMRIAA